jgi:hypothetical protein
VRQPLVSFAQRVVVRHGGCARANGRAAATRRLGVTSGTGAAGDTLFASGAKQLAAEDEQT